MPELDPSLLDFRPMDIDFGASKKDDPLNWNSQDLSDPLGVEIGRHEAPRDERAEFDEEDMNIELDLDLGFDDGPSVEIGSKVPPLQDLDNGIVSDEGNILHDFEYDEKTRTRLSSRVPSLIDDRDNLIPDNGGIMFDDDDTFALPPDNGTRLPSTAVDPRLQRDSQSPLSSARSSMVRDFDPTAVDEEERMASLRQVTHKAKRRKVIQADPDTMLTSTQIKQQQADRSAILSPATFLSRDPILLSLMNMQRNGGFVSSIMGDGRAKGWAPELRGILSIEMVRTAGGLKRKRESGVTDRSDDEDQDNVLEIPLGNETLGAVAVNPETATDATDYEPPTMVNIPADDGFLPGFNDEGTGSREQGEDDEDEYEAARDSFDNTTAPLLDPMEQGAVSQGTKHAVHLLRDRFGSFHDGNSSQQKKASILFQDMLPEAATSKGDATKMFFEVLVLATKDAVKVEQADQDIGSSLRIRAKRNLWSRWSEDQAGGEIAEQDIPPVIDATS